MRHTLGQGASLTPDEIPMLVSYTGPAQCGLDDLTSFEFVVLMSDEVHMCGVISVPEAGSEPAMVGPAPATDETLKTHTPVDRSQSMRHTFRRLTREEAVLDHLSSWGLYPRSKPECCHLRNW